MTEESVTPLRRRMIEDMTVRHFTLKTQRDYIRSVTNLARFLGRPPDTATREDLRRFQLHLTASHAAAPIRPSTSNSISRCRTASASSLRKSPPPRFCI